MRKILLAVSALLMLSTGVFAQEYELINEANQSQNRTGVGLGIGTYKSLYKGIDEKAYPVPLLDIQYGNFYIKGLDIGYGILENDNFALSVFVDPMAGYKVKGSDLASGYNKINDRDLQAMFGARLDIDPNLDGLKVGMALSGGQHGSKGRLGIYKPYSVTPKFVVIPSVHMIYYSSDFTDYYFGVDSEETFANRPGNYKLKDSYSPDAAYSIGATLVGEYRLKDNIALTAFLGLEKYSNEISDSPIVEDDYIYSVGIGAKYYF